MYDLITQTLIQTNDHISLSALTVGLGILVCGIFAFKKDIPNLKIFAISLFGVTGITLLLKEITKVPRPDNALIELSDYSFPSGHASIGFFVLTFFTYYILSLKISRAKKIALITLVIFFGFCMAGSRLILNVHTIGQSIVGAMIGFAVTAIVIYLIKRQ